MWWSSCSIRPSTNWKRILNFRSGRNYVSVEVFTPKWWLYTYTWLKRFDTAWLLGVVALDINVFMLRPKDAQRAKLILIFGENLPLIKKSNNNRKKKNRRDSSWQFFRYSMHTSFYTMLPLRRKIAPFLKMVAVMIIPERESAKSKRTEL